MTYELLTVENFNEVFANQMGKNPSIFFYLNESNDKIESVAYFGEPIKSLIDKTEIDTEYEKLIPKLRFIAKIDWCKPTVNDSWWNKTT